MLLLWVFCGSLASAVAVNGSGLDCTNDFEGTMTCYFDAKNCSEHNVSLQGNDGHSWCVAQRCSSKSCCCSIGLEPVLGETHQASVWRGQEEVVRSKNISITETVRPKAPRIVAVKDESNGIFRVLWKCSGKQTLLETLTARVRWRDGDSPWESTPPFKPSTIKDQFVRGIQGQGLKPSTQYSVSVSVVSNWSGLESDWSQEVHFTTPASASDWGALAVAGLSLGVLFIVVAAYWCCVWIRSKWWDSGGNYKNLLLGLTPRKETVLMPEVLIILRPFVEPQVQNQLWSLYSEKSVVRLPCPSSCSSTCSSGLPVCYPKESVDILARVQDALSKDLFNLKLPNEVLDASRSSSYGVASQENRPGAVDVENRTYCWSSSGEDTTCSAARQQHSERTVTCTDLSYHSVAAPSETLPPREEVASGPSQVLTHHLHMLPRPDHLIPAVQGYQAFQAVVDGASGSPALPADHLLTHISSESPSLSLIHATTSPSVVLVSGYQCVPAHPCA